MEDAQSGALGRADAVADRSTLSWVNVLLGWIWPRANTALTSYVHEDLTPRLQESLLAPFKNAHFSRFTLGQKTPEFGPVEVIRHSETHVEVDLELRYISDVDICLHTGTAGIALGINQLTFVGRLCFVLQPLVGKWPVIGSVKLFFASLPEITLRFTGLASLAQFPGVDMRVQNTVDEWLRSRFVLPSRAFWQHIAEEECENDMVDAASFRPLGVLRVRVLRGNRLAGVNWQVLDVDHFSSDPYCSIRLGQSQHRTSTVVGSTEPEWPKDEPSAYFVVQHLDQRLEVDVLGEDRGGLFARNFTALLGELPTDVSVWRILTQWQHVPGRPSCRRQRLVLDTQRVSRDMLHVNDPVNVGVPSELELEAEWFSLADAPAMSLPRARGFEAAGEAAAPVCLLQVEIRKGAGFPVDAWNRKHGLRWRCRAIDAAVGRGAAASSGATEVVLLSRRGNPCDVEEVLFPDLPIHPRLFPVIDKLLLRGVNIVEVAQIVGLESPDVITLYSQLKEEYDQKHQELEQQLRAPGARINLEWNEVVSLLICSPDTAAFTLELLDGEDRVVGQTEALDVRHVQQQPGSCLAPRAYPLVPAAVDTRPQGDQHNGSALGGFGAWLRPAAPQVQAVVAQGFAAVELTLSARLCYLAPSSGDRGMLRAAAAIAASPRAAKGGGGAADVAAALGARSVAAEAQGRLQGGDVDRFRTV